jgi:hypothetical protein
MVDFQAKEAADVKVQDPNNGDLFKHQVYHPLIHFS